MKQIIPLTVLAAIFATSSAIANTAYSTPSGYVTENLLPGFNLIGVTLHNSAITAGSVTGVASGSVSDSTKDFGSLLTANTVYILEITSGASAGSIQEIGSWTEGNLNTPESLEGVLSVGDTYLLRKASTIASVFGANNEAGLLEGGATTADVIWIPNSTGGFDQFFRQPAQPPFVPESQWAKIGSPGSFANEPIVYADAIFVQRRAASELSLVLTGEVKVNAVASVVAGGGAFNYVGGVFPVGSTLDSSGLAEFVLGGTATTADIVWVPNGLGGYNQYFYQPAQPPFVPSPQWVKVGTPGNSGADSLTSGIIVQRRGASGPIKISPPAFYSNL